MDNGNLVVGFLTSQAAQNCMPSLMACEQVRYHCILFSSCSAGLALPASMSNQRAVLLPSSIRCSQAQQSMASPWASARNVSGARPLPAVNWTLFNMGSAVVEGHYQLCALP